MKLIPNASGVAKRAWEIRLIGVSIVLQGVAEVIPYFMDSIPAGPARVVAIATMAGAAVARLVHQKGMKDAE